MDMKTVHSMIYVFDRVTTSAWKLLEKSSYFPKRAWAELLEKNNIRYFSSSADDGAQCSRSHNPVLEFGKRDLYAGTVAHETTHAQQNYVLLEVEEKLWTSASPKLVIYDGQLREIDAFVTGVSCAFEIGEKVSKSSILFDDQYKYFLTLGKKKEEALLLTRQKFFKFMVDCFVQKGQVKQGYPRQFRQNMEKLATPNNKSGPELFEIVTQYYERRYGCQKGALFDACMMGEPLSGDAFENLEQGEKNLLELPFQDRKGRPLAKSIVMKLFFPRGTKKVKKEYDISMGALMETLRERKKVCFPSLPKIPQATLDKMEDRVLSREEKFTKIPNLEQLRGQYYNYLMDRVCSLCAFVPLAKKGKLGRVLAGEQPSGKEKMIIISPQTPFIILKKWYCRLKKKDKEFEHLPVVLKTHDFVKKLVALSVSDKKTICQKLKEPGLEVDKALMALYQEIITRCPALNEQRKVARCIGAFFKEQTDTNMRSLYYALNPGCENLVWKIFEREEDGPHGKDGPGHAPTQGPSDKPKKGPEDRGKLDKDLVPIIIKQMLKRKRNGD